MKCIEIIAMPPGEAPEEIRKSWIGVVIPLPLDAQTERERTGYGVLTGPHLWFMAFFPFLYRSREKLRGFSVGGVDAITALAKKDKRAAEWWTKNTPHLVKNHWRLIFPTDACRIVEQ